MFDLRIRLAWIPLTMFRWSNFMCMGLLNALLLLFHLHV